MKGFGAIMAAVAAQKEIDALTKSIRCPLCGDVMKPASGTVFFCPRSGEHSAWLSTRRSAAFAAQRDGEIVFWVDLELSPEARKLGLTWNPEMQGAIIAVSDDGLWAFNTSRGEGGATFFRVCLVDSSTTPAELPTGGWLWAEWTGKHEETD